MLSNIAGGLHFFLKYTSYRSSPKEDVIFLLGLVPIKLGEIAPNKLVNSMFKKHVFLQLETSVLL